MELTILLCRIFGVYFIILSAAVFLNRKSVMLGVVGMFKEHFGQLLAAMMALLGGLTLINLHNDWSSLPSGIISAIGWVIFIKGLIYAFVPDIHLAKFTKVLNERTWYTMDGILALVFGIYLTGFGYGLW